MATASLTGGTINFDYCRLERGISPSGMASLRVIERAVCSGFYRGEDLAIANLEFRTADLLAAKAEVERQQEEEKLKIEDEVLNLLLDYEAANRKLELLTSNLETLEQQRQVVRIAYKYGRGSTNQLLGMENRRVAKHAMQSIASRRRRRTGRMPCP